jgi:putative iron-regulated protein
MATYRWCRAGGAVLAGALLMAACGDDDKATKPAASSGRGASASTLGDAVATYARGVHASYAASLESARAMDAAVDVFVAGPTAATLEAARDAWRPARVDYSPTEAFRFYGGPIDDATTGKETFINAWPLDEAYIDYVAGDPQAGIINHPELHPVIDEDTLLAANEDGGEANISTGWHAIEFLLWGQDLDPGGPGNRPVEDYTTNPNADRRKAYLTVTSELLVKHLAELVDAWAPGADTYRARFEALPPDRAMAMALTGLGELGKGELAGQRMNVAYSERSQEDEHSCFSDNTTADLVGNARGIQIVLEATYPGGVTGTSVLDVVREADASLADRLRSEVAASVAALEAIPAPFDQHVAEGVADGDPGRASILTGIEDLERQTDTLVAAAAAIPVSLGG